jgi:hypothetical protein
LNRSRLAISLSFFTSFGIFVYWMLLFSGIFSVVDLIPGYIDWFMAFPLADLWIGVTSFAAGLFLVKGREIAVPFGITAGSGSIFLGLYAFLYGFNTGLLFILTVDEIIEILIKIYALSVGTFFIIHFWNKRNTLSANLERANA